MFFRHSSMASSLQRSSPSSLSHRFSKLQTNQIPVISRYLPVTCGPRDNRGPLVKGRVLSIEAIQAVQSLKRAQKSDPDNLLTITSKTLSRLLKADLLAALKELLRQDQCALALVVFSTVRSEYNPGLSLYADLASALARNGMAEDIDRLICELEKEGMIQLDDKGLLRLIKAVIAADRKASTVRIYSLMKKSGFGAGFKVDDYVVKVLTRGLRRLGEASIAQEVEREFGRIYKGNLEKCLP